MARKVCAHCHRPEKVCICGFVEPISNQVEVGILQHPSEVKQVKGTAFLTHLCLSNSRFWVGESLADLPELQAWLQTSSEIYLLYPDTEGFQEEVVSSLHLANFIKAEDNKTLLKILVLDGTWRKTYKMMQLNPELQRLKRVSIAPSAASNYIIRKQKNEQSLSTLEAIAQLMADVENNAIKYQPLLKAFTAMQQQQLQFIKPTDK